MGDGAADPPPQTDMRTSIAMSERMAVVETQLREGLPVIRSNIHAINQEMQKFVAAEQRCADSLGKILEAIKDFPVIVTAVTHFNDMRPEILAMMKERDQRAGVAELARKAGMFLLAGAALIAMIGGMGAGLIWLVHHLRP